MPDVALALPGSLGRVASWLDHVPVGNLVEVLGSWVWLQDVAVDQVRVRGVHSKVPGTRAWLPTTTVWTGDLRPAPEGVLGTQDFDVCGA